MNTLGINKAVPSSNFVDLTVGKWDGTGDDFEYGDPHQYIDSAQANESIKALLQGAVEDDNDKPRPRARKMNSKVSSREVFEGFNKLNIAKSKDKLVKEKSDNTHSDEVNTYTDEEEEEDDDGAVEGLNVRLLPHQVDGVSWMMDKEIGKRKNGILPKGGILADDVSFLMITLFGVFANSKSRWGLVRPFNPSL